MPRKAFIADLREASKIFIRPNIADVRSGEDDGQVTFSYAYNGATTDITALVPELGDYPDSHMHMFFTDSDHVDPTIEQAIGSLPDCLGLRVSDMLSKVVSCLDKSTSGSKPVLKDHENAVDGTMEVDTEDEFDAEQDDPSFDSEDDAWNSQAAKPAPAKFSSSHKLSVSEEELKARLVKDLTLARDAGFRIAHGGSIVHGGMGGYISLSIRVARLGISEEALDAWNMSPTQYFIVILKYDGEYQPLESLTRNAPCHVKIRVGLGERYKVSSDEVFKTFEQTNHQSKSKHSTSKDDGDETSHGLGRLFISRPLEELLNTRLVPMIKSRMALRFQWQGAENFFHDFQGCDTENDAPDPKYWVEEDLKPSHTTADHLSGDDEHKSFPLLTMQYALRHLTRCTEFCLVCHCKVRTDFEALKPYVCSNPLCLYQYMSLGFGPSIEHEIITQPYVVDLLISFCYFSAYYKRMRHLPVGLALMVPPSQYLHEEYPAAAGAPFSRFDPLAGGATSPLHNVPISSPVTPAPYLRYEAKYDRANREIAFVKTDKRPPVSVGAWVTLTISRKDQDKQVVHCQILETNWPIYRLSPPVPSGTVAQDTININPSAKGNAQSQSKSALTPPPYAMEHSRGSYEAATLTVWNQNFDELDIAGKFAAITLLLDSLPMVPDMKTFLLSKGNHEAHLRQWTNRIVPSALGLLRWIIASNRSCIVQVDSLEGDQKKSEQRVSGMPGWMQFRFAQGAPDKEQRFITSIKENTATQQHPTLFAWHGSPIYNWHGIVREGLNFERVDHGRAFGDGVYHAMDVSTSVGYSGGLHRKASLTSIPKSEVAVPGQWGGSQLNIAQAVALNEIINSPRQFRSTHPHLVVHQVDWIQSRYLFVQCNIEGWQIPETEPTTPFSQDPTYHPRGVNQAAITLPINAVGKARRPRASDSAVNAYKKLKTGSEETPVDLSDDTDSEDRRLLCSDPQCTARNKQKENLRPGSSIAPSTDPSKTAFTPNTLDAKTLILLDPPTYATSTATKSLQRELQTTLKTQSTHPLHELGWYMNPDLITSVYQWIIELHSFDLSLPLAKDLLETKNQSIVLEIRFGASYPMSPPFVRIIRPRFLPFLSGGGGHVTAGGALCMELLTNSGWSAVLNIESVLLQVRLAISSTDPRPARLQEGGGSRQIAGPGGDYTVGEAEEAFVRACRTHGWQVPSDFRRSITDV